MPGNVARIVDNGVPAAALECLEAVIPIALVGLQVRKYFTVGAAAIEELHFVPAA
jgi:hypothetical protein